MKPAYKILCSGLLVASFVAPQTALANRVVQKSSQSIVIVNANSSAQDILKRVNRPRISTGSVTMTCQQSVRVVGNGNTVIQNTSQTYINGKAQSTTQTLVTQTVNGVTTVIQDNTQTKTGTSC